MSGRGFVDSMYSNAEEQGLGVMQDFFLITPHTGLGSYAGKIGFLCRNTQQCLLNRLRLLKIVEY